jgi:hypothetical protein
MEGTVYLLCGLTALACGFLLLRSYKQTRTRLLLWCGIFFVMLAMENGILFLDLVIYPQIDLTAVRKAVAMIGVSALLYGLIWETRR